MHLQKTVLLLYQTVHTSSYRKVLTFHFSETYSGHKHRNLIKPMMAVFTDCYNSEVFGPYPESMNDASILNELLRKDTWNAFEAGDVFLVDRSFRNSIAKISEKGFIAKMPEFADSPTALLTTEQANRSRFVTKSCYIVEVINRRLKNFEICTLIGRSKIRCFQLYLMTLRLFVRY